MSRWEENFRNHEIHQTLENIEEHLPDQDLTGDEREIVEKRRLRKIVAQFKDVLSELDEELAPDNLLNGVNNNLKQHVVQQCQNFYNNKNLNPLIEANNQASNNIQQLAMLRSIAGKEGYSVNLKEIEKQADSVQELYAEFRKTVDEYIKQVENRISEIKSAQKEIQKQIENNKSEVNKQIAQWQQQFSEAQENRNKEFGDLKSHIESEFTRQLNETLEAWGDHLNEKDSEYTNRLEKLRKECEGSRDKIHELLNLAADDSVAGGYVKTAKVEGRQALSWRIGAIGFITLAAIWLFYSFLSGLSLSSIEATIASFGLTAVLLFGAAYAAQQSTKHRSVQVRNQKIALEMATIDPYLQDLPDEDKKEIKKELTTRFFGNSDTEDRSTIFDEHVTKRVMENVGENITKAAGQLVRKG